MIKRTDALSNLHTRIIGRTSALLLALECVLAAASWAGTPVRFPYRVRPISSADGRYSIRNVDNDADSPAWNHRLWLDNHRTGKSVLLLTYLRHVSVAWAPRGSFFFVNNYSASDQSNCRIGDAHKTQFVADVKATLDATNPETKVLEQGHAYFVCTTWIGTDTFKVKFYGWAYDLSHPKRNFERFYTFRIVKGFKLERIDR